MVHVVILMNDLYSTTDVRLLTCVTFASLFQNEAADFRDKSVSITRTKGQGKITNKLTLGFTAYQKERLLGCTAG
jgi:hypothetical protein